MQRDKTKLTVYADYATAMASKSLGANINCVAFNLDFIKVKDANLMGQILALYQKAHKLRSNSHGV